MGSYQLRTRTLFHTSLCPLPSFINREGMAAPSRLSEMREASGELGKRAELSLLQSPKPLAISV